MWKKSIYLTLIFFVFGLAWTGPANAADPNLQLWLKFEDNVVDSSDYARTIVVGDEEPYVDGVIGRAIDLDGNDYLDVSGWKGITGSNPFSIAAWVRTTDGTGVLVGWGTTRGGGDDGMIVEFRPNDQRLRLEHGAGNVQGNTNITDDEWHHVAVTVKENAFIQPPDVTLYLDGWDDTISPDPDTDPMFNIASEFDVRIGREHDADFGRNWAGEIDDLRIYSRELSATDIRVLVFGPGPLLTTPAAGADLTELYVTLEWMAGVYAADVDGHEVFLSQTFEDVNSGAPAASQGLTSNDWLLVMGLEEEKTYYWKVDAVNDLYPGTEKRWSSEIRSFYVPPEKPYEPAPADEVTYVDPGVTLSWKSGRGALLQQVYFGDNFADVDANTPDTDMGQQPATEFTPTGPLANDTTYYWRIDSITPDPLPVKGDVWSFTTEPNLPITEPNLVGYWKLDINEPTGTVAVDHSGYDNHASLRNGASFVSGYKDEAVQLDGIDDYVNIDGYKGVLGTHAFSVAAWINTMTNSGDDAIVGWGAGSGGARIVFRLDDGNTTPFSVRYAQGNGNVQGNTAVNDGEWHHVAMTVESGGVCSSSYIRIYVDGQDDTVSSSDPDLRNTPADADVGIGLRASDGDQHFEGLIDEVRLYDRVLSEIEVARLIDPAKAVNPSPANRAQDVPLTAKLTWTPGIDPGTEAEYTKHNVYVSTNYEDVNAGTVAPIEVIGGVNEVTPSLDYYNYYYWRVDGVNAGGQAHRGFIWSFKATYDPAQIVDPNLLAWYKFDGDATDSSGYGRDAIESGGPTYGPGFEDQAILLDGIDDTAIYSFPTTTMSAYTITMWVKATTVGQDQYSSPFSSHTPNNAGFQLDVDNATPRSYRYHDGFDKLFGPVTTGWVHLAVACDGARTSLFYNGSFVPDVNYSPDLIFNEYAIGINRNAENWFEGAVDEVRIYDYELPDEEIVAVMRIDPARAWMPNPGDGASGVEREPTLSWAPGNYAPPTNGHYVYFGADDPCNLTLIPDQPQSPNNYSPGVLDLERTYYWAVDEANAAAPGGVNPGKIWSFTITNYLSVDDMEAYNAWDAAPPYIFEVWVDGSGNCGAIAGNGTGSLVDFVADPCTPVLSGSQSMKLEYDNDGMAYNPCPGVERDEPRAYYSKIVAQIANLPSGVSANWVAGGAKALSVQFYGDPNNDANDPMWVELTDGSSRTATVAYGIYNDEHPNDIAEASWHDWNINLQDFNDAGVNVGDVSAIAIGFGTVGATAPGGSGTVYFDQIRLYGPRCFPLRAKSPADFDNNCQVGYGDLEILTDDWLISGYDFTVADSVSDANLEAHYAFEDNLLDSSANLRHADPNGTISYAAGKVGTLAVDFDGTNYAEVTGYKGVTGTQDRTCTAWIKTATPGEIVIWGMNTSALKWIWRIQNEAAGFVAGAIRLEVATGSTVGKTDLRDDQWHHVAVVLESAGSPRVADLKLYVDGLLEAPSSLVDNDVNTSSDTDVRIGKGPFNERPFIGQIDELRIYSRALEQAEVASLAGLAGTVTQPLLLLLTTLEDTDLFDDETINFKDYARLLDAWLDVVLWP